MIPVLLTIVFVSAGILGTVLAVVLGRILAAVLRRILAAGRILSAAVLRRILGVPVRSRIFFKVVLVIIRHNMTS